MAATKIAKKVNKYFVLYASEHIQEIDMDKRGLYCMILSENDENMMYRVDVDESDLVPVATGCSCTGSSEYGYHCKHAQAVELYYQRIYKSNVAKFNAKQEASAQIAKIEAEVEAVKDETEAHNTPENIDKACKELRDTKVLKVGQKGCADLAYKGNLNGNRAFVRPSQIAAQAS